MATSADDVKCRAAEGRVIQNRKIFRDRPIGGQIEVLDLGDAAPATGVGHDDGGVNGKGSAAHDAFLHVARDHRLQQFAQEIALGETAPEFIRRKLSDNTSATMAVSVSSPLAGEGQGERGPGPFRRVARPSFDIAITSVNQKS